MSKFKSFLKNYDAILKSMFSVKDKVQPTLVFGYSSYFLNRFQIDLASACRARGVVLKRFDSLNHFIEAKDFESGVDLFGEQSLHFVKMKTWTAAQAKLLKAAIDHWQGILVILLEKPVGGRALNNALAGMGISILEVSDPWPSELSDLIHWLCGHLKIKIASPLVSLLAETLGSDLGKLENELRQIALIDSGQDLNPNLLNKKYLQGLVEKNVFKIQDLLAQTKAVALQQQLFSLLEQGESAHGILAVVSRCYGAALASPRHASFSKAAMTKNYANPMTQKKYDSIANAYSSGQLLSFYKKCQIADLELKGGHEQPFFLMRPTLPQV